MTFEQIKAKLKLHKLLVQSGTIVAALASMGIIVGRFEILHTDILRLLLSGLCYIVCMAALASVWGGIHYIATHTKCLKCKRHIDLKDILKMHSFVCPYCGNEKFDNDTVEIWFK